MNIEDLKEGVKIGKLTIIKEGERYILPCGQKNRTKIVKCDCGTIKTIRIVHLVRMKTTSCGCAVRTRGGLSNTDIGKLYRAINYRCSENYFERHLYFDKGISVCDQWKNSFESFYNWALPIYKKGLHIDRRDNSKGYSPDNCRFVDQFENANNRDVTFFVTYNGKKEAIRPLLRRLGKIDKCDAIIGRIKRGVPHNIAIDRPIRKGNYSKTNFKNKPSHLSNG